MGFEGLLDQGFEQVFAARRQAAPLDEEFAQGLFLREHPCLYMAPTRPSRVMKSISRARMPNKRFLSALLGSATGVSRRKRSASVQGAFQGPRPSA